MAILTGNPSPHHVFDRPANRPDETPDLHVRHHDAEAPDRGDCKPEAPESRAIQRAEAPDRGEGRMALLEHEFTHGRSQS